MAVTSHQSCFNGMNPPRSVQLQTFFLWASPFLSWLPTCRCRIEYQASPLKQEEAELTCLLPHHQKKRQGPLREKLRKGKIPRLSRSEELEEVIRCMMRPNPTDRPTADDLLATVPQIREILMRRLESNWVPA